MDQLVEYYQQVAARYRVPNFARIWNGAGDDQEEVDGRGRRRTEADQRSFWEKAEPYLIRLQEWALWTDPTSSMSALVGFHVAFWFLTMWCTSAIYTAAWFGLVGFVYITWTRRIWPEIRVEEPESEKPDSEDFTPMHPDCMSAPEIQRRWMQLQQECVAIVQRLKHLRQEKPGKFCALASTFFVILAFAGSFVSTLGLIYLCSVGILTVPGLVKLLMKHPTMQCFVETVLKPVQKTEQEEDKKQHDQPRDQAPSVQPRGQTSSEDYLTSAKSIVMESISQGTAYVSETLPRLMPASTGQTEAVVAEDDLEEYIPKDTQGLDDAVDGAAASEESLSREPCAEDQPSSLQDSLQLTEPIPDPEELEDQEQPTNQLLLAKEDEVNDDDDDFIPQDKGKGADLDEDESSSDDSEVGQDQVPPAPIDSDSSLDEEVRLPVRTVEVGQQQPLQDQSVITALREAAESSTEKHSSTSSSSVGGEEDEDEFELISESELSKAVEDMTSNPRPHPSN